MAASSLPGRINITVSTASGETCTIAALASGRVDQLHGAIERVLRIPPCVQNLIIACDGGAREIRSQDLLSSLPLQSCQHHITVFNSWPQDPAQIVEKLKAASRSPTRNTAAAVARCLTFEDSAVQAAALQALSWMGKAAKPHAPEIAELLKLDPASADAATMGRLRAPRGAGVAAAESLSWLEEAGSKYAADILRYGWYWTSSKSRHAFVEMCESDSSATRLAATTSLIAMLEHEGIAAAGRAQRRREVALPYICRAVFDECDEIHRASAACLMQCVPSFAGENDLFMLGDAILVQLLWFGEAHRGESTPGGVSAVCRDLATKLDGFWPQFAGWQEGLHDEEEESVEAATQVAVSTVHYLRRRFQQWAAETRATFNETPDMSLDLIESLEAGLLSRRWQVRKAVVESLIAIAPWGAHAVLDVLRVKEKEKRREVLDSMSRFLSKYQATVLDHSTVRQCFLPLVFDSDYSSDDDLRRQAYLEEEQDGQMRDKHGGYLKSHVSRTARHHKQHGANSSQAPSWVARKKKWERRERRSQPSAPQAYSDTKKKSQRDKEQDRQLKAAILGRELLNLSMNWSLEPAEG